MTRPMALTKEQDLQIALHDEMMEEIKRQNALLEQLIKLLTPSVQKQPEPAKAERLAKPLNLKVTLNDKG